MSQSLSLFLPAFILSETPREGREREKKGKKKKEGVSAGLNSFRSRSVSVLPGSPVESV